MNAPLLVRDDMQLQEIDGPRAAERDTNFLFDLDELQFIQSLSQSALIGEAESRKLKYILESGQTELSVVQLILNLGMASETDLLNYFSVSLGLRILDSEAYPTELFCENSFNRKFLREQNVIVVSENEQFIEICINDPFSAELGHAVSFAIGNRLLKIRLGFKKDISEALDLVLRSDE